MAVRRRLGRWLSCALARSKWAWHMSAPRTDRLVALIILYGLVLTACTHSLAPSAVQVFRDNRFAVTFDYPAGLHRTDKIHRISSSGSNALAATALAADHDNVITIAKFDLHAPVTKDNLDRFTTLFDNVVANVSGRPEHGASIQVGGLPALRYDDVPAPAVADGTSRVVLIIDQTIEYSLTCQSTPAKRLRVIAACDQILLTLS